MAGVVFECLKDISNPDAIVMLEERTYNSKCLFFSVFIFLLQLSFPCWPYWGTEAQDGCDPTAPDLMHLCPAPGLWREGGQVHILPADQPLLCNLTSLYSCDNWMLICSMFGYGAHTNLASVVFCTCKSSRVYQHRFDWSFSQGEFKKMQSQNLETERKFCLETKLQSCLIAFKRRV